jgi:hypothetical protein
MQGSFIVKGGDYPTDTTDTADWHRNQRFQQRNSATAQQRNSATLSQVKK